MADSRRCIRCEDPVRLQKQKLAGIKAHNGRGLCGTCYQHLRRVGGVDDYERQYRTRDEVMEAWAELHRGGYTRAQAAGRLGMTTEAFYRAHQRARRAGDPRAKLDWIQRDSGVR